MVAWVRLRHPPSPALSFAALFGGFSCSRLWSGILWTKMTFQREKRYEGKGGKGIKKEKSS